MMKFISQNFWITLHILIGFNCPQEPEAVRDNCAPQSNAVVEINHLLILKLKSYVNMYSIIAC